MTSAEAHREHAFGQVHDPSVVDRFGVWLSGRQVRKWVPTFDGKAVGDFGCGYEAKFARSFLHRAANTTLVDVALHPDLKSHQRVDAIEGRLPDAVGTLQDGSLDVVMLLSVLEHLWDPLKMLHECRRVLRPAGTFLVNVPTWRGKRMLEFSAFRLGLSPEEEMDDHKTYYDVKDLWPLLVQAGFIPHNIHCFRHKFGLNLFAACSVDP